MLPIRTLRQNRMELREILKKIDRADDWPPNVQQALVKLRCAADRPLPTNESQRIAALTELKEILRDLPPLKFSSASGQS